MNPPEEKIAKVTHLQFMQAVDALRKHKQEFLNSRPDHVETAKLLSDKCGFRINRGTAAKVKEASGVAWESRRKSKNGGRYSSYNAIAVLTRSLHLLFKKLDEEPPAGLRELHDYLTRKTEENNGHE